MKDRDDKDAGKPAVHFFGEVSSTFDVAWKLAGEESFPPWSSVFARSQTTGRGQMRRHWESPPGNIYATIRFPHVAPFTIDAAAIACATLCSLALARIGCPVLIKWPNDLVLARKGRPAKVAGILLEERGGCIMAGIGINLAHAPDELPEPSLAAATLSCGDLTHEPARLWLALAREMQAIFMENGLAEWREAADASLLWRGRRVNIQEGAVVMTGILRGIATSGAVIIAGQAGEQEFLAGSLSLAE